MCTSAEEAIRRTIPPHNGLRERYIFEFCRELQALAEYAKADPRTLEPLVRQWYAQALPTIGTKQYAETLAAFLRAWDKVKIPKGQTAVHLAFALATLDTTTGIPEFIDNDRLRLLAAVCRELQKMADGKPFFLDCRAVGELFGVTHRAAWKWLDSLCALGVLEKIRSGSLKERRANDYRYRHRADT